MEEKVIEVWQKLQRLAAERIENNKRALGLEVWEISDSYMTDLSIDFTNDDIFEIL